MRFAAILTGYSVALPAFGLTLGEALDAAWARRAESAALPARAQAVEARRQALTGFTAAPPSVGISYRTDQVDRDRGVREWEAELGMPMWLPGERVTRAAAFAAERTSIDAEATLRRWQLAGELRETLWQVRITEAERLLARERVADAEALLNDVQRQVNAGDLARIDLLAARQESLAAREDLRSRESAAVNALRRWVTLTGIEALPAGVESPAPASPDTHPAVAEWMGRLAEREARLRVAERVTRDPPEVSVFARRERGDLSEPYNNSLGLRLKLPLATESRNRPAVAAIQGEVTEAAAELVAVRRRVDADIAAAREALRMTAEAANLASERSAAARESYLLVKKAFDAGEFDLAALLRAQAQLRDATRNAELQRLAADRAQAVVDQAMGGMPK